MHEYLNDLKFRITTYGTDTLFDKRLSLHYIYIYIYMYAHTDTFTHVCVHFSLRLLLRMFINELVFLAVG